LVVHLGGQRLRLPDGAQYTWQVSPSADGELDQSELAPRSEFTFGITQQWKVTVTIKKDIKTLGTPELLLDIKKAALVEIYKDKRRQSFNRELAALLVALFAGIAATRVFGLTFGSCEEYLGAPGWGVGASLGVDPAADGAQKIREELQK
jgi:hypothetical protein